MVMDDLNLLSSSIRWQDIVDILLTSYILFRLYILFRGTNVFRVLIGIAILWFFQKIASLLGLIVTSWSIQGFTGVATIIIIVIFRNEIRSVLQTKNYRALLWEFPKKGIDTPVETIVDSVFELSKKGTGALIVLSGKEDISETVHSGIKWEGLVSKEMLMSIFWHDNPVHDGAAVVQGDHITQVGSILPLSRRKDLPSYYGTRHRAALGLAEITDCLVIAVSEERNDIVAAKGSNFYQIRKKAELTGLLNEHVGIHPEQFDYLKRQKLEFATAAVVSVLSIAAIWFSFTRGVDTLITVEAPLEYMNRSQDMEILDTSVNTVLLDLSGSSRLLDNIGPNQVKVTVDLSEGSVGRNTFPIPAEKISLPPGVFLRNVRPPSVDVTLDRLIKKRLPVQVDWVGKLSDDLSISSVDIVPEKVTVVGGSLILEDITTIYTEPVSLDTIKESGSMTVRITLNKPSLKYDSSTPEKVTIEYKVVEKRGTSSSI
jgi:diadenylate cyclase